MTGISNINITASGTLYTSAPTVTVSAPTLPAGDSAKATGTLTVVNGQVTNFSFTVFAKRLKYNSWKQAN